MRMGLPRRAVARAEADDTLQDNLDAEVTARVAADTALQAVATQIANGMMSSTDKAKLDGLRRELINMYIRRRQGISIYQRVV